MCSKVFFLEMINFGKNVQFQVFDDMIDYLKETNELLDVERDCERVQLLPVACLNTGINLPDHDTTFSLLSTRIKDSQVLQGQISFSFCLILYLKKLPQL